MVDSPSGTSDPEGSDTGPGLTVPDEQPSQEQDLAHMNWHAIPIIAQCCVVWCRQTTSFAWCAVSHDIQCDLDLDGLCTCLPT